MVYTKEKNKYIKIAFAFVIILVICIMFSSCKKKDEEKEVVSIGGEEKIEETANPLIVDPVSADIALDAFLKAIQAGEMEIANSYVWDVSKDNGFRGEEFWQEITSVGYEKLLEYEKTNVGFNDIYSVYNVTFEFALPGDAIAKDSADGAAENSALDDVIASGSINFVPEKDDIIVVSKEEAEIAEATQQSEIQEIYEALPVTEGITEGVTEGVDEGSESQSADLALEGEIALEDDIILTGKQTQMMTVVKENGKYYVSPANLLATYESEDMRSTQEMLDDIAEENLKEGIVVDEEEESGVAQGVFAKLISAKKFSNGLELKIRIENLEELTLFVGSDINEATVILNGIVIENSESASKEMAESYGFLMWGGEEGAIDSQFDTFAPVYEIEPGETQTLENIRLAGLYELIFSIGVQGIYSENDEVTKLLPVEIPVMKTTGSIDQMASPFEIAYEELTDEDMDSDLDDLDTPEAQAE